MFSEVYRNQFLLKISQMKFNGKLILNNFIYPPNKKVKNNKIYLLIVLKSELFIFYKFIF